MKRLHFQYKMDLSFQNPVTDHHFRIRCIPFKDEVQTDCSMNYRITPSDGLYELSDGFGNCACIGTALDVHEVLEVRTEGTITIDLEKRKPGILHPMFKYPSVCTIPGKTIKEFFYKEREDYIRSGSDPAVLDVSLVMYLMKEIWERLRYEPGATTIHTLAEDAWFGGCGVCQDYAHIMITLCRMHGIPARYAAGMTAGEGATHAWVEVYLDGFWIGADPTNNRLNDESYIKLSHGRDFSDCAIDKGCFRGYGGQQQKIYVKVEELS